MSNEVNCIFVLQVSIGFAVHHCSCLKWELYAAATRDSIIAGLIVGLVIPFFAGIIIAICYYVYYDKPNQLNQRSFDRAGNDYSGPYNVKLPADDSEEESETAVDNDDYTKQIPDDENANSFKEVADVHTGSDSERYSKQLPGIENPNYSTT